MMMVCWLIIFTMGLAIADPSPEDVGTEATPEYASWVRMWSPWGMLKDTYSEIWEKSKHMMDKYTTGELQNLQWCRLTNTKVNVTWDHIDGIRLYVMKHRTVGSGVFWTTHNVNNMEKESPTIWHTIQDVGRYNQHELIVQAVYENGTVAATGSTRILVGPTRPTDLKWSRTNSTTVKITWYYPLPKELQKVLIYSLKGDLKKVYEVTKKKNDILPMEWELTDVKGDEECIVSVFVVHEVGTMAQSEDVTIQGELKNLRFNRLTPFVANITWDSIEIEGINKVVITTKPVGVYGSSNIEIDWGPEATDWLIVNDMSRLQEHVVTVRLLKDRSVVAYESITVPVMPASPTDLTWFETGPNAVKFRWTYPNFRELREFELICINGDMKKIVKVTRTEDGILPTNGELSDLPLESEYSCSVTAWHKVGTKAQSLTISIPGKLKLEWYRFSASQVNLTWIMGDISNINRHTPFEVTINKIVVKYKPVESSVFNEIQVTREDVDHFPTWLTIPDIDRYIDYELRTTLHYEEGSVAASGSIIITAGIYRPTEVKGSNPMGWILNMRWEYKVIDEVRFEVYYRKTELEEYSMALVERTEEDDHLPTSISFPANAGDQIQTYVRVIGKTGAVATSNTFWIPAAPDPPTGVTVKRRGALTEISWEHPNLEDPDYIVIYFIYEGLVQLSVRVNKENAELPNNVIVDSQIEQKAYSIEVATSKLKIEAKSVPVYVKAVPLPVRNLVVTRLDGTRVKLKWDPTPEDVHSIELHVQWEWIIEIIVLNKKDGVLLNEKILSLRALRNYHLTIVTLNEKGGETEFFAPIPED